MSKALVKVERGIPKVSDLVDRWLGQLDAMPRTRELYRISVQTFLPLIETRGQSLTREDVITWRNDLLAKGLKARTINGYTTALRSFFAWLESQRLCGNICAGIRALKADSPVKQALSIEDVKRILAAIPRDTLAGRRDFALFNLMARTGLRGIECHRAKCNGLKREGERWVLYVQGKGRNEADKYVILTDGAYKPLLECFRDCPQTAPKDVPLFPAFGPGHVGQPLSTRTMRSLWTRYATAAGVKVHGSGPHILRHTAATQMLRAGAPVQKVMAALRHSKIDTTMQYLRSLERTENPAEDFMERAMK